MLDGGRGGGADRSVPAPDAQGHNPGPAGDPGDLLRDVLVRGDLLYIRLGEYFLEGGCGLLRIGAAQRVYRDAEAFALRQFRGCTALRRTSGNGGRTGHHLRVTMAAPAPIADPKNTSEGQWAPVWTRE